MEACFRNPKALMELGSEHLDFECQNSDVSLCEPSPSPLSFCLFYLHSVSDIGISVCNGNGVRLDSKKNKEEGLYNRQKRIRTSPNQGCLF